MIYGMDFKPVVEQICLEDGDGSNYSAHVSEIIDEIISSFLIHLNRMRGKSNEEIYSEAYAVIDDWLKCMRESVNKQEQSVTWAKNILYLLAMTLDSVKDWHPNLLIIHNQLKSMVPPTAYVKKNNNAVLNH